MMSKAEKRLRLALLAHQITPSPVAGYFLCWCGCGYIGVCRHCVPSAPAHLPWMLCDEAKAVVQSGRTRCEEGFVYASAE